MECKCCRKSRDNCDKNLVFGYETGEDFSQFVQIRQLAPWLTDSSTHRQETEAGVRAGLPGALPSQQHQERPGCAHRKLARVGNCTAWKTPLGTLISFVRVCGFVYSFHFPFPLCTHWDPADDSSSRCITGPHPPSGRPVLSSRHLVSTSPCPGCCVDLKREWRADQKVRDLFHAPSPCLSNREFKKN